MVYKNDFSRKKFICNEITHAETYFSSSKYKIDGMEQTKLNSHLIVQLF